MKNNKFIILFLLPGLLLVSVYAQAQDTWKLESPDSTLHLTKNGQEKVTFTPSGSVGIGRTDPHSELHVVGSAIVEDGNVSIVGGGLFLNAGPGTTGDKWMMMTKPLFRTGQTDTINELTFTPYVNGFGYNANNQIVFTERGQIVLGGGPSVRYTDSLVKGYPVLLSTNGAIVANTVRVTVTNWSDHVFEPDYNLMPMDSLAGFIQQYGHLPGVPSQDEIMESGNTLGQTDAILLEKIEELTLYLIEMKKENEALKARLEKLENATSR